MEIAKLFRAKCALKSGQSSYIILFLIKRKKLIYSCIDLFTYVTNFSKYLVCARPCVELCAEPRDKSAPEPALSGEPMQPQVEGGSRWLLVDAQLGGWTMSNSSVQDFASPPTRPQFSHL